MAYTFMVVDDSSVVRKVMRKTLALTGLPINEIHEAENGAAAIEKLRNLWVDLVFLDINMPVMNGMEFMEVVRKDADLKDLPVVVVSTEGSQERIDRLNELDIKAYLRKPMTPEGLVDVVINILGKTEA